MPDMASIKLSEQAEHDLEGIWVYTFNKWSAAQANKYIDEFDDAFQSILDNPKLGKPINYIRKGYRQFAFNKHLIYYFQSKEGDIHISRILHQNMDQPRHLQ